MGRKKQWNARAFESKGTTYIDNTGKKKQDTSAAIYESMLSSAAFKDLKTRTKMLYIYCKAQFFGKRKPVQDFPEIEQVRSELCFYLNLNTIVGYGLYTKNMRKEFYDDLKSLEEHGFIEIVSSGRKSQTNSIYKYSSKWQQWTKN